MFIVFQQKQSCNHCVFCSLECFENYCHSPSIAVVGVRRQKLEPFILYTHSNWQLLLKFGFRWRTTSYTENSCVYDTRALWSILLPIQIKLILSTLGFKYTILIKHCPSLLIFHIFNFSITAPPWGRRGFKSRIRPPYPQRVVKGD